MMKMGRMEAVGVACFTILLAATARFPSKANATEPLSLRAMCGAYYFDGWTSGTASYHLTERLRTEFADREPLTGWSDESPQVMQTQIDTAADHGLAFFAFDWYYPEGQDKYAPMNNALELYLKAPNRERLQFCLMVANHGGFRIGAKEWPALCRIWVKFFLEPTHLRVGGKPLLIFFSPAQLSRDFGTTENVKAAFDILQQQARDAGLQGVSIAGCTTPGPGNGWQDLGVLQAQGYACFTGYNYHGWPPKGKEKIQAFANMVSGHEIVWNRFAERSPLPYMPVVTVGWDKRPWEDRNTTAGRELYYPDRTPHQVADFVNRAIQWIDHNPTKTTAERIVLLYAWNENGEGGYIIPTKGDDGAYLKAVYQTLKP